MKVHLVFALTTEDHKQLFCKDNPGLTRELLFEMAKSVFWRDEEVTTNVVFQVMTRSEIPDMAGSVIPDTAGRKTPRRRTQAIAKCYAFHANAIINDCHI